jgi:hypothetical protein
MLLTKLHYFGIKGASANRFLVLPNRKQKREIKSPYTTQSTYSNWGTVEHGISINTLAAPIIFADDMRVIISARI